MHNTHDTQHLKFAIEFDRLTGANNKTQLVDSLFLAMLPSDFSAKQKVALKEHIIDLINSEE